VALANPLALTVWPMCPSLGGCGTVERASPECREVECCELRPNGVLGSSSIIMAGAPTTSKGSGLLNNLSVMRSGHLNGPLALGMLGA
jgi:hypothetical protein